MSAEMAHIPTGGHVPPPAPPERYTGHDLCVCGHFLASHIPLGDAWRGPCYDPDDVCPCRTYDADLPLRRRAA